MFCSKWGKLFFSDARFLFCFCFLLFAVCGVVSMRSSRIIPIYHFLYCKTPSYYCCYTHARFLFFFFCFLQYVAWYLCVVQESYPFITSYTVKHLAITAAIHMQGFSFFFFCFLQYVAWYLCVVQESYPFITSYTVKHLAITAAIHMFLLMKPVCISNYIHSW